MATVEATAPRGPSNAGPPHNLEAEESVIGAILLSDRALYGLVIEEGLRADDFYREQHKLVYQAILDLYDESCGFDTLTVTEHLRQQGTLEQAGGEAAIHTLAGAVPSAGNARHYAKIVRDNALMRRLQNSAYQVLSDLSDRAASPRELVEQAERRILEVGHDDRQKDFRSIQEVLHDELDKLHRLSIEGTSLTGVTSGFTRLDDLTGGFQPGNLIIIAARPSMGKSSLVANIAENAALDSKRAVPVALFSLEMSESELAQRFVSSQASIKGDDLSKGRVAENVWPKITKATNKLAQAPLYIDDSSDVGLLEIRAKARRLHAKQPLGLIIVDYLQLLRADGRIENRVEQVSQMSRGLKVLARELNVPVIALSQLNRSVEQRQEKVPV